MNDGRPVQPPVASSVNALWRIPQWFPDVSPGNLEKLAFYHAELLKFNGKINLISRNTERDADEVHFADCLLALKSLKPSVSDQVFDIGSGNGLPGLILAIMNPGMKVSLVDSDIRKTEFLKHMVHALKLNNATIYAVRFESLNLADARFLVSRGFANLSKTVLACNRAVSKGAQFFHLKGTSWSREIADLPTQLISAWKPELAGEYTLPVSQVRRAVVLTTKVG